MITEEEMAEVERAANGGDYREHTADIMLRMVTEVRRLRAFIEEHAFDRNDTASCLGCPAWYSSNEPHAPNCELVALLGRNPRK